MIVGVTSRSFSKNEMLRHELLKKYPNAKFNDTGVSLSGKELVNFLFDCNKAIIALETLDKKTLSQLPNLSVIGKYGVGLDKLDLKAMSKLNIKIGWTSGVNKRSVSELALAFMINSLRKLRFCHEEILIDNFHQVQGENLTDKIVGIVGCGNVGKDLVQLLKPFKCKILVNDIIDYSQFYKKHSIISCELNKLITQSDIITLHTPLTKKTHKFFGIKEFSLMKKNAVLINTARGKLVDDEALLKALDNNWIGSAAFDVFYEEPPKNKQLLCNSNFIMSPHIGGSTKQSIIAMGIAAIKSLENPIDPISLINYQ